MSGAAMATGDPSTPPDDVWTREVCNIGAGAATCRFLTMSAAGWSCEKYSGLARVLTARAEAGTMVARSDNCTGRAAR